MVSITNAAAALASALTTLLNLLGLAAAFSISMPRVPAPTTQCRCFFPDIMPLWHPIIDNPEGIRREGVGTQGERGCAGAEGKPAEVVLVSAPSPSSLELGAPVAKVLFACILLDPEGGVKRALLTASSGTTAIDGQLVAAIETRWRFAPWHGSAAGWQRVQLHLGRTVQ